MYRAIESLCCGAICLLASTSPAQRPFLVKDLNTTPYPNERSDPGSPIRLGADLYFAANTRDYGRELWRSVGGTRAPQLVHDIVPGVESSEPQHLTVMGTALYFSVRLPFDRHELWRTDGTAAGTKRVAHVRSPVDSIASVGQRVLVGTNDGLWVSDGTTAGTRRVSTLIKALELRTVGRLVFFQGTNTKYDTELWKSDGTVAGTSMVKDIIAGSSGSYPALDGSRGHALGNQLLFFVRGQLWASDGTQAGTIQLTSSLPRGAPHGFTSMGGKAYLLHFTGLVTSLLETDGTPQGTKTVKVLGLYCSRPVTLGNAIYFTAPTVGSQSLWRSDGTAAGTQRVTDHTYVGTEIVVSGGHLFFSAYTSQAGWELWRSDGSKAGTLMVADLVPGVGNSQPSRITPVGGGRVLFSAWMPSQGPEMAISDGTKAGTRFLGDIKPDPRNTQSTFIRGIDDHAGLALVRTDDLWASDGNAAGTIRLHATTNTVVTHPAMLGKNAIFAAGGFGPAMMKTDGTAKGTLSLGAKSAGFALVRMGPHVYFAGMNSNGTAGLWRTDGTPPGTIRVALPMVGRNMVQEMVTTGGALFFRDDNGNLWISDGTNAGTVFLDPAKGKTPWRFVRKLHVVGKRVYFVTGYPTRLFLTDGTTANTRPVADATGTQPQPDSTSHAVPRSRFAAVGDVLYFRAKTTAAGAELWRTDGSPKGTLLVRDIRPKPPLPTPKLDSHITGLTALGRQLMFFADDGKTGVELWKTDGTTAGTVLVKDIHKGPNGLDDSRPTEAMLAVGNYVYFAADDGVHGCELWRSDGTAAGTTMVAEIVPGAGSSYPHRLALSGGAIYFTATDPRHGFELWKIDATAHAQEVGHGCANSLPPSLHAGAPVIGAAMTMEVRAGIAAMRSGVLVFGTARNRPIDLAGGCALYFDPAKPFVMHSFRTNSSGVFQLRFVIPNQSSLHGLTIPAQAGVTSATIPPRGLDFTAGLSLAIRRL